MFTFLAFLLITFLAWYGSRGNTSDRKDYDQQSSDTWLLTLHIRQDIKIIVFFLGGIIVMLGVIADRIH